LTVHLGDEEVRVLYFRRGHTDGDSVVYFPDQKVVHMGDLFVGPRFPFIDRVGGGDSAEWIATIDGVLRAVHPDSKFIAGHGEVGTRRDLEVMREYLVAIRNDVRQAVREGKSLRETIETIDRAKYNHIQSWFMKLESNIAAIYEEMKAGS
jgi:glyoxylase-like metal-dependent hydrolase (beta-lactamase superfamily II)